MLASFPNGEAEIAKGREHRESSGRASSLGLAASGGSEKLGKFGDCGAAPVGRPWFGTSTEGWAQCRGFVRAGVSLPRAVPQARDWSGLSRVLSPALRGRPPESYSASGSGTPAAAKAAF